MRTIKQRKFVSMFSIAAAGTTVAPLVKPAAKDHPNLHIDSPKSRKCTVDVHSDSFDPIAAKPSINVADLSNSIVDDLS